MCKGPVYGTSYRVVSSIMAARMKISIGIARAVCMVLARAFLMHLLIWASKHSPLHYDACEIVANPVKKNRGTKVVSIKAALCATKISHNCRDVLLLYLQRYDDVMIDNDVIAIPGALFDAFLVVPQWVLRGNADVVSSDLVLHLRHESNPPSLPYLRPKAANSWIKSWRPK